MSDSPLVRTLLGNTPCMNSLLGGSRKSVVMDHDMRVQVKLVQAMLVNYEASLKSTILVTANNIRVEGSHLSLCYLIIT